MTTIEAESQWIDDLPFERKLRFLARLSWEITVAGRGSYEAGADHLANLPQLRCINEVQHRVTACLSQLLDGRCPDGFVPSIATCVLAESCDELGSVLQWAWMEARKHVLVDLECPADVPGSQMTVEYTRQ